MDPIIKQFQKNKCLYCCQDLDREQWHSSWDSEHHYKRIKCSCGKENWVKVNFDGSGHDFLFKKELSPLEATVRKVRERL